MALAEDSLTLRRGEAVAITGRSGSGKSTLLNILGLLDVPDHGAVLMNGHRVDGDSDRRRSQRRSSDLGFVFQRSHLIPALSARENVLLGLHYANPAEESADQLAEASLRAVGLADRFDSAARTLSGGEMQRVAIARTLARPASLWLADEPTGNLDSTQSAEIIELLKGAAAERGACLVVVTHDPEVATRMGRVVTLHDGRIVADTATARIGTVVGSDPSTEAERSSVDAEPVPNSWWWPRVRRTAQFIGQGVGPTPAERGVASSPPRWLSHWRSPPLA